MDSKVFRGIKVATAGLVSVGLVSGLALLSFGIFSLFDSVNGLITEKYIPGGLIILGACISIVAALGLLGLAANNRAVILSFAILAGILLLAQVSFAF